MWQLPWSSTGTGSLNLFNHQTNVKLTSHIVCIVLKGLGENLRKIAMHVTNDFVTSAVNVNFHSGVSTGAILTSFISCSGTRSPPATLWPCGRC